MCHRMPTFPPCPFSSSMGSTVTEDTSPTNSSVAPPTNQIIEAADGKSGLTICRSRRIDCVVLEMTLPDQSGLEVLMTLIPRASKPRIAVIVLTQVSHPGVWRLTKENGAYAALVKGFTSGQDLDKAIQRAVAFVGQMPKDDRYRPI